MIDSLSYNLILNISIIEQYFNKNELLIFKNLMKNSFFIRDFLTIYYVGQIELLIQII